MDEGVSFQMGFYGKDKLKLPGDAHVAIDGDTQFTGNFDFAGSVHTFLGKVTLLKHQFISDEDDPLVFKLIQDKGFVYQRGKGTVTRPDGTVLSIP